MLPEVVYPISSRNQIIRDIGYIAFLSYFSILFYSYSILLYLIKSHPCCIYRVSPAAANKIMSVGLQARADKPQASRDV